MTNKMPACKFTFDTGPAWAGYAHDSTWNGFDNVAVTRETLDAIIAWSEADGMDADTIAGFRELQPMANGLYSLGWGYSTQIVTGDDPTMEQVEALAERFAAILKEWLTETEWTEMKRRNETDPRYVQDPVVAKWTMPDYMSAGACASHDFCDANMAMDQAWRERFNVSCDGDNEGHCAIWNRAWEIAREKHLGQQKT